jgi:tetratricopeptide (TPR) repeat protein
MYRETKEAFEKTLGEGAENRLNLAYELAGFGCLEEAAELLGRRPAKHPMEAYTLAYALNRIGRREEAVRAAEQAESMSTDLCFPNRNIEKVILEEAAGLLPAAPKAHYYLGELLYDKKQYEAAIRQWELAVREAPELAPAHRNLSIACYNHGERSRAAGEIAEACRLEPGNSRFLLEQEQLLKNLGYPARERLAIIEAHRELAEERYALMLAYIHLLNADGQHEKALELLTGYTFHVWEGGEGKVADEYKAALFALAEKALEDGRPEAAYRYAERTLTYPENLGEGKLDNVPDNRAYYLMGTALRQMKQEEKALECFRKAAEGSQVPEPVRYYNDQPSDYIYWQGLAFRALGEEEKALKSFHQLITFGEQHLFDRVGYDFFAVSMPELEVYQDDIQKRSDEYCRRMAELGNRGLQDRE